MQKSHKKLNINGGANNDLTNNPGNGFFIPISKTLFPHLTFYQTVPEQYLGLEIFDGKYYKVNWEYLQERAFSQFYQTKTSLFVYENKVMEGIGSIHKMGDNWPVDSLIPRDHVRMQKVDTYDLLYTLKWQNNEEQFEVGGSEDFGFEQNPTLISQRLKRGYDYLAFYVGRGLDHE